MKRILAWSTFLLLMGIALPGCDQSDSTGSDGSATTQASAAATDKLLKIAVIPKGTTHEHWKAVHAGARKAELELPDVLVEWKGPTKEDDREQQINVVENFITAGVDGIVLAPLDDKALVRPVREASEAGIGVVIFDSGLDAEVGKDFVSFVTTDNYEGGRKAGKRLGEILDGKGKVLMMRYQIGSASTEKREQGFLDVIKEEYPDIELVSTDQYAGATTESAYATAEPLLIRYQDLDGIYCPNESSTSGMLRALQVAGRAGEVKFVGFDTDEKLIEAMREGELHGLVVQDPINMGYLSAKTLVQHLRGEEVPEFIDTGSIMATPENMDEPAIANRLRPLESIEK